jgi:CubicO group peptidase (beta-lactamase class C family)
MADRADLAELASRIADVADERGLPLVAAFAIDGELVARVERGYADRRFEIPNTVDTVFGMASVTKGITGLVVMSLVADGVLELDAPVRRWLGDDLPLIDDAVTIDHLLTHCSGIGDYLDEEALEDDNDYVMPIPVHLLSSTEAYLSVLDGFPQVSAPGAEFVYNNGAFVVLALVAERVAGESYHRLAQERVLDPAGMVDSAFHRTDELPAGVAAGYLELDGLRTNVLHLPVLGTGDGGVYSTVTDLDRLWRALFAGQVVPLDVLSQMSQPMTPLIEGNHYGRGMLVAPDSTRVSLVGGDVGISVVSTHDPSTSTTGTVVSNSTPGAWPAVRLMNEAFA